MWSESLNIRLSMTAAWLVLAACLLAAARFAAGDPASLSSVAPVIDSATPAAIQLSDRSVSISPEDAG